MTWIATLHGDVTHLGEEGAAAAETAVRDALSAVAEKLVGDGHQGVAATFHGSTTGDTNLLQPDAPVGEGPPVTGEPVEAEPVEAPAPGDGAQQEQAPGTAAEPTGPPDESAAPGSAADALS